MKLKLIALAAMLAAGSVQAAIDSGLPNLDPASTGNGELLLNLKWKDGNKSDGDQSVSAAFDLGVTMNEAASWNGVSGFSRSWDLNSYGNAFGTFTAAAEMANAEMNVIAFDGTESAGEPGEKRVLSTTNGISATGASLSAAGTPLVPTPVNDNFNNIFGNVTVNNFLVAVNNSGSHNGAANGASNADATSGFAWFDNGTGMDKFANLSGFDSTGKFDGSYAAGSGILSGEAKALPFYMLVASSTDPIQKATMTPFGYDLDGDGVIEFGNADGLNEYGLWTLQGSTLTYANPTVAAVPEAETYAMMLAGLGLVGFMVRRRSAI
ncbi:MAG: PEP-CTERM sorting domain-containing protein [Thiobacillus sp.]